MDSVVSRRSAVDDLAGVEDSVGVESVADGDVEVGDGGGQLGSEAVALEQADAVLAGDRAADRERGGDDLGEGELGTVAGVVVARRRPISSIRPSISGTLTTGTQTSSVSTGPSRSTAG